MNTALLPCGAGQQPADQAPPVSGSAAQSARQDRAVEQLIPRFIQRGTNLAVITNDLATKAMPNVKRSGSPIHARDGSGNGSLSAQHPRGPTLNIQAADELRLLERSI
jgi:urease accessory protein